MRARPLALAALALVATACASGATGRPIAREQVNAIARGVTTTAEVRSMFGDPDTRSVAADGSEAWSYSFNSENQDGRVAQALCPAVVFVRYLFLPLGGLCNPIRIEQDLSLTFDERQVVATLRYANREVNLADRYRERGRRDLPIPSRRIPGPVVYGDASQVASQTR